jgi:DGQHR domain-containing protein
MPQLSKISLTDGHVVPGVIINDNQFVAALRGAQLFQIVVDPRLTENEKLVADDPALASVREVRSEVQRVFDGAKKRNVPDYAAYIENVHHGEPGLTPAILLWSKDPLVAEEMEHGTALLQIPYEALIIAIDGETQLAARFEAAKREPATKGDRVAVIFCHGRDASWARQAFHDVNTFGVRPNSALAIGMDARDPLTAVARELEISIPFFKDRVNTSRRQLGKSDKDVVTIAALRGACVTVAKGISGVKDGAKSVYLEGDKVRLVREVATVWFKAVTQLLGPAIEDREHKVAGAPPVLAAIGAMGHELMGIADPAVRQHRVEQLIESLRSIKWERGEHWSGIAGKMAASGKFSVGGTKEVAYQVYNALMDSTDPGYVQIRRAQPAVAA